jgi:porin
MPVMWLLKHLKAWMTLVGLIVLFAPDHPARAQPYDLPDTWGGDILSRPRLTGDWDGLRDELGKKGIVLDVDLLMTPQVVMSGGRSTGGDFWGNADYTLNVDTQKLGLWPGGFFKISAGAALSPCRGTTSSCRPWRSTRAGRRRATTSAGLSATA